MKATDFQIGDQFRIHGKGHDSRETYTVKKVESDYIVSEGSKRFRGCDCVTTDTALGAMVIEMVEPMKVAA